MIDSSVLVLNQNYEPLNICNGRRAIVLLSKGKAESLENGRGEIRCVSYSIILPSIIRLLYNKPITNIASTSTIPEYCNMSLLLISSFCIFNFAFFIFNSSF